jgi:hypothetical protein
MIARVVPVVVPKADGMRSSHADNFFVKPEFSVPAEARRKHMALFGGTGTGKSALMRNMIATDIASGIGCTVIDPHGQLVEELLDNHIPRSRTDDVIYFNPKDPGRAIPLNLHGAAVAAAPQQSLWAKSVTYVLGTFCYPCLRAGHEKFGSPSRRPVSISESGGALIRTGTEAVGVK